MVATCYRHALRVSELVNLQWSQVGLDDKTLWVVRGKKGKSCVHHLEEDEIEAFRELKRITKVESEYVFCTSQGLPLSRDLFAWLVRESAKAAGLGIKAHPHMLRHAKGYMLINKDNVDVRLIQDFMGHKNIQTTVLYTTLDSRRMKGLSGW
jgi:type 1 fimbriae regulatory protein FimB/type 1 fimbriae regulatory protein FimE